VLPTSQPRGTSVFARLDVFSARARSPQIARAPCPVVRTDAARLPRTLMGLPTDARMRALGIVIPAPGIERHAGMRQWAE
jgi:hypothetical protein